MAKRYVAFRFTVSGPGDFPYDMLRYDRCVPESDNDVYQACCATGYMDQEEHMKRRSVTLIGYTPVGTKAEPTRDRWRSFGWTVGKVEAL